MTKQTMSSVHEMVSDLEDNHIPTLRQIRTLAVATQKLTREVCGVACVYARGLKMDAERRAEFYAEAFPRGWQRFHRSKLLLHVLMYFYGVTGSDSIGYGTASAHSVALRVIYEDHSISDDDVMAQIESRGIFACTQDDDDVADGGGEEPSEEESGDRGPQRRAQPVSIFSDQDDDDLIAEDEEADQENGDLGNTDNVVHLPVRKRPKPAVSLPRLQWRYVELCVLGRPKSPEDREAILGPLRDGKSVWVKLTPGKRMDYEICTGGGPFIDTPIEDYKVENE